MARTFGRQGCGRRAHVVFECQGKAMLSRESGAFPLQTATL